MMMLSSGTKAAFSGGTTTIRPPDEPLADVVVGVADRGAGHARGMKAPKLWPADPLKCEIVIVSSGSPSGAVAAGDLTAEMGAGNAVGVVDRHPVAWTRMPFSSAGRHRNQQYRAGPCSLSRPWFCLRVQVRPVDSAAHGAGRAAAKGRCRPGGPSSAPDGPVGPSLSVRPTISLIVRKPSAP